MRMYQLKSTPTRLDDFNDYFVRAITEDCADYYSFFLHFYEPILNTRVERYIEFYHLPSNCRQDLKQIFATVIWEQMQKYDVSNKIPLLQIAEPIYKRAWNDFAARNVGAVSMPEKAYAVFRKVAAVFNRCIEEGMSESEAEAKVYEHFTANRRIVKLALQMLPTWRETVPILNKSEPDEESNEQHCAYEESIADPSCESPDTKLWREEVVTAFRTAAKVLSYKEKQIFEKINGVTLDTLEIFKPIDRQTIALDHNYSDESGVRKAEFDIYKKLAAELCESGFAWAVSLQKASSPASCPKAKNLRYYRYFPNCGKDGGWLVFDSATGRFEVVQIAKDDTMNSLKYATLAVKGLEKLQSDELPSNLLVVRFAHAPYTLMSLQWVEQWSRRSPLHTRSDAPNVAI